MTAPLTWEQVEDIVRLNELGYDEPTFEKLPSGEWVATSHKDKFVAQAIGRTQHAAAQQLVKVISRP